MKNIINNIKKESIIVGLIIICFIFRIYKLDFQSPWGDELFTLINSSSSKTFGEIFDILKVDVHPPLYYYIVHVFFNIFGDSIFLARLISVFFAIVGMISLYFLAIELFNKRKIGVIAVALLVVNHFLIYYSQEARMYSMLFFTTTMSFLFLIKFIKKPSFKSAILHAFFALLMIYTHFFALFTLFAEYIILLFFVITSDKLYRKKIFHYSFLSGVITAIVYIPALIIFLTASSKTSFWIPIPESDVYTSMYKEFFGFSEIPIFIVTLAILYFFVRLFNKKQKNINIVTTDKNIFPFFILFVWVFITLLIPFILSYVNLPIIISRYFINIIPPIILFAAAGFFYMRSDILKYSLISVFVFYSLTDLFFVKDYYNRIMKTQYREVSQFVIEKNKGEKILSSFEYYFSYFLKKEQNNSVTKISLNEHVENILKNQYKPESFWYIDINDFDKNANKKTQLVLDSLFVVDDNIALFDAYAKHYHLKSTYKPKININKFKPFNDRNGSDVNYAIEIFNDAENSIDVSGWIYFYDQSMQNAKIYTLLINDEKEMVLNTEIVNREDVTSYFKSDFDLSRSGFKTKIIKDVLEKNKKYRFAIYLIDEGTKKEGLILTDKLVEN